MVDEDDDDDDSISRSGAETQHKKSSWMAVF